MLSECFIQNTTVVIYLLQSQLNWSVFRDVVNKNNDNTCAIVCIWLCEFSPVASRNQPLVATTVCEENKSLQVWTLLMAGLAKVSRLEYLCWSPAACRSLYSLLLIQFSLSDCWLNMIKTTWEHSKPRAEECQTCTIADEDCTAANLQDERMESKHCSEKGKQHQENKFLFVIPLYNV